MDARDLLDLRLGFGNRLGWMSFEVVFQTGGMLIQEAGLPLII